MIPEPLHLMKLSPIARRLLEQYFNTYCRETGCFDPRLVATDTGPTGISPHIKAWRSAGLMPFLLTFAPTGYQLTGALTYFSPVGYHRVAPVAWIGRHGNWLPLTDDIAPLIDSILDTLAAASGQPAAIADGNRARLKALMYNSIAQVHRFHRHKPATDQPSFMAAEQGLRFGHIFHVTSKAMEGFSEEDLQRYSPELGASFRLHYFAVTAGLLETRVISGKYPPTDPEAALFAEDVLGNSAYRLLPCHPWQANHLLSLPGINALIKSRELISLGPLGEVVWPTSSVRTVWLPRQNLFLKLSLNLRITNFIRNNPPEQVKRALDASLALSLIPRHVTEQLAFCILPELAAQTLQLPDEALQAACAVVYRQAMSADEAEHVQVAAAILEEPANGEIPLLLLLRLSAQDCPPGEELIRKWWKCYLNVTLLPLLRLFLEYGISLEAHLQNTLIAFSNGWPVRGYVRDMEGASISRQRFPFLNRLPVDSPVLYTEKEAWHRFQYYVLVNHIAHTIACLARTGLTTEAVLWRDTATILAAMTSEPLVRKLLTQPTLPAKANMLSSFYQHGEHPSWVEIPNPLTLKPTYATI